MAAQLITQDVPGSESDNSTNIVNFTVVRDSPNNKSSQPESVASFESLMLPHLDAAHNLARWLVGNDQDAQDIVQEAYLRAFKSFGGFHGANGRPWLLTIVRNTSYTFMQRNRAIEPIAEFDEEKHATESDSSNPMISLEQAEDAEMVRRALDQLPAEFREILVLRHLEGLSYKEIAEIAHLAPGTVMSRLARARMKLREVLMARKGKEI